MLTAHKPRVQAAVAFFLVQSQSKLENVNSNGLAFWLQLENNGRN